MRVGGVCGGARRRRGQCVQSCEKLRVKGEEFETGDASFER